MRKRDSVTKELARIIAKYKSPEDVDNAKDHLVTQEHFCWGCKWGTPMEDRFLCPFVQGSCARFPQTLSEPDPDGMQGMIDTWYKHKNAKAEAGKAREAEDKRMKAEAAERKMKAVEHAEHIEARAEKIRKIKDDMMIEAEREKMITQG